MKATPKLSKTLDTVGKRGTAAWQELKRVRTFGKWLEVGEALVAFRTQAMHEAATNEPVGSAYNGAMGRLLEQYRLDDIDKSDRARLVKVMDKRDIIEKWYGTLPLNIRLNLNHPTAILRRWEKTTQVPKPRDPDKLTPHQKTEAELAKALDRVTVLERENAGLKEHIADLEAARETLPKFPPKLTERVVRELRKTRKPAKARPQADLTAAM